MAIQSTVDAADLAQIPLAKQFVASLFLGAGKYAKREAATLTGARREGSILMGVHTNGRKPIVYAIVNSRQILIPDDYQLPALAKAAPKEVTVPAKAADAKAKVKVKKTDGVQAPKKTTTAKKASAPKAEQPAKERPMGQRAAIEAAAREGKLPAAPDFSAATHKPYRAKLEAVVALARAGDAKALKAFKINPSSTSPKAIIRYRDLCVLALEAKTA